MNIYEWSVCSRARRTCLKSRWQSGFCPLPKRRQAGAVYASCRQWNAEYVSLATDAIEKWELPSLIWIICSRREQLSDSHPPLHALQPSQSISQICAGSGLRRRKPLCPFLGAVVDALRVKGLIELCKHLQGPCWKPRENGSSPASDGWIHPWAPSNHGRSRARIPGINWNV